MAQTHTLVPLQARVSPSIESPDQAMLMPTTDSLLDLAVQRWKKLMAVEYCMLDSHTRSAREVMRMAEEILPLIAEDLPAGDTTLPSTIRAIASRIRSLGAEELAPQLASPRSSFKNQNRSTVRPDSNVDYGTAVQRVLVCRIPPPRFTSPVGSGCGFVLSNLWHALILTPLL